MANANILIEQELRWLAEVNEATTGLSRALGSLVSLDGLASLVLEHAMRLTDSTLGCAGYIDPQTGRMVNAIVRDSGDERQVPDQPALFEQLGALWGWVLDQGQPLLTNAPADDPRLVEILQGHVPVERFLGVPVTLGTLVVGMVALANPKRDYAEKDLAAAERLAALYALAIQRARMEDEIKGWNETLEQRVQERTAQLAAACEDVRQSEARFRHLYENAPVMMHSTNPDGTLCDVNRKWLEETGYARDAVIGQNVSFLMTPESAEHAFSKVQLQFEREGAVHDVPYQFVTKSGAVMDVLVSSVASVEPSGKRVSLSVVRNVTRQKRAEHGLRLQSAALEAAANAVVITNRYGRILWANPAFTSLTGYTLEQVADQSMRVLKSDQQDQECYRNLWETILAGQVWEGELVNRRKDGSLYVEAQTITPVLDEHGGMAYFVAVKQDVTKRKRAEQILKESEERYRRRSTELQALYDASLRLNTQLDTSDLLRLIVEQAVALLNAEAGGVYIYDAHHDELFFSVAVGSFSELVGARLKPGEGLSGQVFASRRSMVVQDYPHWPERAAVYEGKSFPPAILAVPLLGKDDVVGVLNIGDCRGAPTFDDRDIGLAELFAAQAALALENARLYARAQQRTQELVALHKAAQAITSVLDRDKVLRRVVDEARELLGAEGASVLLCDSRWDALVFAAVAGPRAEALIETRVPITAGVAGWVVHEKQPAMVNNARRDPRFYSVVDAQTGLTTHSLVAAPLVVNDVVIGVIEAINPQVARRPYDGDEFTAGDLKALEIMADSAAMAIENARLYEQARREIAERKQAEESLRESEQKFRALVESADDIIALHDPADGHYLFAHLPGRYRFALRDLEGQLPQSFVLPDMAEMYTENIRQVARQGIPRTFEHGARWQDERLHFLTTLSPIKDESGRVSAVMSISRDITEQKHMQTKMIHTERLAAIGKLAAMVAHQLTPPLQSVVGNLGLVQEAATESGDARQYLYAARDEMERIARIVARMRDLYQPESDEKRFAEVESLLAQVLELGRKRCQENQIEVEWLPGESSPVLLAPDQIRQVFLNLLINAIEAMPDGGRLQVGVIYTEFPAGVRIRFSDTGVGIPLDVLPHIFEPFYSARPQGAGLGLSISYHIVSEHGGRIEVESEEGKGSTFTVWLPA